jgi:LmbE family N-acetylglucosaminyl deacetylase
MNTHADHTVVSAFTTAAFHWAASPKRFPALGPIHIAQRLFYNTSSFFFPGRPAPLPAPWTVALDVSHVEQRKFDAFRAHTSQLPLMDKFESYFRKRAGLEVYTLANSPSPGPAVQATDLFSGL